MSSAAQLGGDVDAWLKFNKDNGQRIFTYDYPRTDGGPQFQGEIDTKLVTIRDGRSDAAGLSLDKNGVMLVPHETSLNSEDFYGDPAKILRDYYEEMRQLVAKATGASRVIVFDHNVRNVEKSKTGSKEVVMGDARSGPVQGYALGVHGDYTDWSASERIKLLTKPYGEGGSATHLGKPLIGDDEVDDILSRRYIFINVWRNISEKPIASHPFAFCDGSTMDDGNFLRSKRICRDRVGEQLRVKHDSSQQWLYFGGLRKNEAILLKTMDSAARPGLVRYTAHSAFKDPRTTESDPPRESAEVRCIAIFDDNDTERTAEPAAKLFDDSKECTADPAAKRFSATQLCWPCIAEILHAAQLVFACSHLNTA
eukprot:gnl/TRDRNA2_/TRDRNA2_65160_c0_seq1.p1 gnl/TRDRNA2_/TRDRNA2_65160_c0~~gnl/TRDRNA2_/TRDRNA2_65160_c0_seq1.p1  ORF type:complete len:368 (+),score=59.14 gnl/TRDRNA2_/TRDRNA2_65160_c0_seq1:81-1184(+)